MRQDSQVIGVAKAAVSEEINMKCNKIRSDLKLYKPVR